MKPSWLARRKYQAVLVALLLLVASPTLLVPAGFARTGPRAAHRQRHGTRSSRPPERAATRLYPPTKTGTMSTKKTFTIVIPGKIIA